MAAEFKDYYGAPGLPKNAHAEAIKHVQAGGEVDCLGAGVPYRQNS
ncbi:MAG: hypothetical protein JWL59_3505 [Chthoniobacteraceae bacterium]|nr:hypothetical protein [Chthoniobacteraceae bacterium]